jgi:uncharacterized repeat protein (TIGR03803 family)
MNTLTIGRYALCSCVAAAMLSGCGGSQPPIGAESAMLQRSATTRSAYSDAHNYRSLFSFDGDDGALPSADLIVVGSKLYGTTTTGQEGEPGNIYDINQYGVEHVLYTFSRGSGGGQPYSPLLYVNGAFYGTTPNGGEYSNGSVFKVPKAGGEAKLLESFSESGNGSRPIAGLVLFHHALYGTTSSGGIYDGGTIFKLTLAGKFETIHNFGYGTDGSGASATMTVVGDALYGTTGSGGAHGVGTVFETNRFDKERVVYSFGGKSGDGSDPAGTLIAVNGELYGTTVFGGAYGSFESYPYGNGIVFKVDKSGNEEILHNFQGYSDGSHPLAGLLFIFDSFYGTTSGVGGSSSSLGTVFKMSSSGTIYTLHTFNYYDYHDGEQPRSGLTLLNGALYGTTYLGGQAGEGTVFRISP